MKIVNFKNPEDSRRNEAVFLSTRMIPEADKFILISSLNGEIDFVHAGFTKYEMIALLEVLKSEVIEGKHDEV